MIRAYLDTSVVAAYFSADALSDSVVPALSGNGGVWWVSDLVAVELSSVMARRARDNLFTRDVARMHLITFDRLVAEGQFVSQPLTSTLWRLARELLLESSINLRTLDALHLALALDLYRSEAVDTLWTGDRRLADAAAEADLSCRLFEAAR